LGQHLVLVNGTKSFTIPDRADDSNPNMLCVTTARLRVLAHAPSSLRTCPCAIELAYLTMRHMPHRALRSCCFGLGYQPLRRARRGCWGVVLGVVLGGSA